MYSGEDSVASIAGAKFHTAYLFDPSGSTNRYVDEFVKPLASRLYEFFNMVVVNRFVQTLTHINITMCCELATMLSGTISTSTNLELIPTHARSNTNPC